MQLKGYELRTGVEQAFNKVCAHLNLKHCHIIWSGSATTASINSSRIITLPNIRDDSTHTRSTLNRYIGYVFHELLHHKYTDFSVTSTPGTQYLHQLHNAVEDAWIERTAIRSNLVPNALNVLKTLADSIVDESLVEVQDWTHPGVYPFALAIHARGFAKPVPLADGLKAIFDIASDRIDLAQNTYDTFEIAKWVYDQLQLPPEKPSDQPRKGEQGNGKGESGDQPKSSQEPSNESAESSGQQGGSPGNRKIVDGNKRAKRVEPSISIEPGSECQQEFDSTTMRDDRYHTLGGYNFDTSINVPGRLRYEVRKLFENSAHENFEHNRKSGQLHTGALHKIGHSDRLFKRHNESAGIESAVVIILDVSGSMFQKDNKLIKVAVPTCATLCDTLERAGVATSILTFNSVCSVLKPFKGRVQQSLPSLRDVVGGGGTDDYSAIRHAHDMLFKRSESRKVAFVLTDGVGQVNSVREQVQVGERLGITTIGVGICTDVSGIYTNSINIDNVADLAKSTFNQIKLA